MEQQRDFQLDFLRIAAVFAVVWLHVAAGPAQNPDWQSAEWWTGNVADALSRWCVPVFVMISGALLLAPGADADPIRFYRRRAARLLVPLVFWTAFYLALRFYIDPRFTAEAAVSSVIAGTPYYHLWFLYMIVGLYAVTPFLRQIVAASPPWLLALFVAGCFVLSASESLRLHLAGGEAAWIFLPSFLPYIGYFVCGYALHARHLKGPRLLLLAVAVAAAAAIALTTSALRPAIGARAWGLMHGYQGPLTILMALAVFLLGSNLRLESPLLRALIARLAPLTFGIFLVHLAWFHFLVRTRLGALMKEPLIGIPVLTAAVFGVSAVTVALMAAVPYLRATVR
ncbi:MAG: acyltransferase [Betaproteobacteria bacterium]